MKFRRTKNVPFFGSHPVDTFNQKKISSRQKSKDHENEESIRTLILKVAFYPAAGPLEGI